VRMEDLIASGLALVLWAGMLGLIIGLNRV
jgi:hypothetical protein